MSAGGEERFLNDVVHKYLKHQTFEIPIPFP